MSTIRTRTQKASVLAAVAIAALVITSVFAFAPPAQSTYTQTPSFKPKIAIADSTENGGVYHYQTVVSGNNVYAIWQDYASGNLEVFFKASKDNGNTFGNALNLSGNSGDSALPKFAVSGNNVYAVWIDETSGNKEAFFARSPDGGSTFSDPINLSGSTGNSEFPQIAVSGSNVYVVWRDNTPSNYEVLLRASNDNGATFGDVINLSNNSGDSMIGLRQVEIAASESSVYVVWQDDTPGNLDIFLARSMDNGKSFSGAANISNTSGSSNHPEIAVTGNIVHVVWLDDTDHGGLGDNYDVFFSTSIDNGNSFSKATNLSRIGGVGVSPKIAASGSYVYVTWFAGAFPDYEVFLTRSTDNGATFAHPVNLSSNVGLSSNPQIAVSGTNVYVVWQHKITGNEEIAGRWDVFLRTSADNGATFGNGVNLSSNGSSNGPQIAVSDGDVYVIWLDSAPGNEGIFFRAGTLTPN